MPIPRTPHAASKIAGFQSDLVKSVETALTDHSVVVVGMAWNPHVPKAREALKEANIEHHYIEVGSYASGWQQRLAIKLWSGWPTFPQVFVKGTLVGGNSDLRKGLTDGTVESLLNPS